jgi:transcriptional regulator with XRE-family HTH domain
MTDRTPPPDRGEIRLGGRLRAARKSRGLTIEQVAARAGLTKSFVSRLERDGTSPSVASLVRLCGVLGIKVGSLFDEAGSALVRGGQAPQVNFGGHGVRDYLFTPTSEPRLQVIESHIEPGGGGGDEQYALASDIEFVYVVEGELGVQVGATDYRLQAGDGLTFLPTESHSWRNPSKKSSTVAVWVLSPAP